MLYKREVQISYITRGPVRRTARPPLLVLFHGVGADELELLPIVAQLDPRLLSVSLRGPRTHGSGRSWFTIDWSTRPSTYDLVEAEEARAAVADLVPRIVRQHGTDPTRTFLLGFSQGGAMALSVALTRPDLVRGVVIHSGRMLADLPRRAASRDALAGLEALVLHGVADPVLPVRRGREIRDFLAPLLGPRLVYVENDAGHGIGPASLPDIARWLAARLA